MRDNQRKAVNKGNKAEKHTQGGCRTIDEQLRALGGKRQVGVDDRKKKGTYKCSLGRGKGQYPYGAKVEGAGKSW